MKKYLLTQLLCYTIFISGMAQEKQICITIDDLPTVTYGIEDENFNRELTKSFVHFFKHKSIPAIGYVNENKLYTDGKPDSSWIGLLELWLQNDLELGNHTFSHLNYHKVGYQRFTADIIKGEQVIKVLCANYNSELKYFRHPYLRSGKTLAMADSLKTFLTRHDYIEAPVTIDNEDYLFAKQYAMAISAGDSSLMKKIGAAYIKFTREKLEYYEKLTETLFDRDIAQVFLIHANKLNADHLNELYELFVGKGYSFVSQAEALNDHAYSEPITNYGDWGISWLERWAISKKTGKALFQTAPKVPEFITR